MENKSLARIGDYTLVKGEIAVAIANKLLNQSAGNYFKTGFEKYEAEEYDLAISDFDKSIEIFPLFKEAYNFRGNCKDILLNREGAIVDYNKAITIDPEYAFLLNSFSQCLVLYMEMRILDLLLLPYCNRQ